MNTNATCAVLNRLWVIHHYSLPSHLAFAPPWWRDEDAKGAQLLCDIVRDQQRLADGFGKLIVECGGRLAAGKFPARFDTFHDLSSQFMWAELIQYQERTIEAIEKSIDELPRASLAQSFTQESLGVAKAHLDSLNELGSDRLRLSA